MFHLLSFQYFHCQWNDLLWLVILFVFTWICASHFFLIKFLCWHLLSYFNQKIPFSWRQSNCTKTFELSWNFHRKILRFSNNFCFTIWAVELWWNFQLKMEFILSASFTSFTVWFKVWYTITVFCTHFSKL